MIIPFLQVVNNVLLDVGESDRVDLTATVSRKCVTQFNSANRACSNMHRWMHLQATIPATSWTTNIATLPPHTQLKAVTLNGTPLQQLSSASAKVASVGWYRFGSNTVATVGVKVADQPSVRFELQLMPQLYSAPTDTVDLPDLYYDAVYAYTKMLMHQVHTTDQVAHDQCMAEFQNLMHLARTRETAYSAPFYLS